MTNPTPPLRVATANEIAKLLRVHVGKVYEMAQSGELPQLRRVGPELRFDMDAIEAWLHGAQSDDPSGVDTGVDTPRIPSRAEAHGTTRRTR